MVCSANNISAAEDDKDAFWLAQVHFAAGNYTRAHSLLSKQNLIESNASCRYLAAHCFVKQNLFADALELLGENTPDHLLKSNAKRKMGHSHPRSGLGRPGFRDISADPTDDESSDRKYEASMCYLRGLCFAKRNAFDRAKDAYKDALRIDVQCYEAFSQLVRNSLMSPDEEDEFMQSLDFDSIKAPGDDPEMEDEPASYVHMLYQTHLSKYRNPRALNTALESLSSHYGLAHNADILLAKADLLYTQCRFKEALSFTTSILEDDKHNFAAYPIHLACLHELGMDNKLYLISHELADAHPDEPCTWLAVGIYYFSKNKIAEARRFFSKASMMDANFGPAWIGFAHTFSAEGEHDQAVTAYSTAARLFAGTHLPQVFLGMQNHAMNNMTAAEEFLKTAYSLCKTDPLLLNEMGIVLYHQNRLKDAAKMFTSALRIAKDMDSEPYAWLGARTNLGHAYRRLRLHDLALEEFDKVLRDGGKDAAVFCAKGLIYLDKGIPDEAVRVLHEALAIHPQDPIATELLSKALEESAAAEFALMPGNGDDDVVDDMDRFEQELQDRKATAKSSLALKVGKTRRPRYGTGKKRATQDQGVMEMSDE